MLNLKVDFILMYCLSKMGGGKTLFTTLYAKEYSRVYPDNKIYANYKLNLPNAIYNPFMYLPYSSLDNCLIIIDDIYSLKNLENFMMIVANYSRKCSIHIILTLQYYTMLVKQIRILSEYEVQVKYEKKIDVLKIGFIDTTGKVFRYKVKNAVKQVKGIYDTNEVVKFPTESNIIKIIKENSNSLDDLELNINMLTKNQRKRNSLYNKLGKELGLLV